MAKEESKKSMKKEQSGKKSLFYKPAISMHYRITGLSEIFIYSGNQKQELSVSWNQQGGIIWKI
jgi:hypothetical protein